MSEVWVSELILGGQKSGKSRRAEELTRRWLQDAPPRRAVLLATAQAWDVEMQARIERHQQDRAERVPGLATVEAPLDLAAAVQLHSTPDTLVVIDCLTLWLTNWLMPAEGAQPTLAIWSQAQAHFLQVLQTAPGPVVLVGNEIGLGVIPLGREVREFVDALGQLNQAVAQVCPRVTLMVAGQPLCVKGGA